MKHTEQLNPILRELVEGGVPLTITKDCMIVPGFYKSETVKLWFREDTRPGSTAEAVLYARDRYGKETPISQLDDLVELNHYWWMTSKDRGNAGWVNPDPVWVQLLVEHGFIEVKEVRTYVPKVQA